VQLDESEDLLENLEDALIQADFGPGSSLKIVDEVRTRVESGELTTSDDIKAALKQAIKNLLESKGGDGKSDLQLIDEKPNVIMVVRPP
jgi:fused signal recognition particle receptor